MTISALPSTLPPFTMQEEQRELNKLLVEKQEISGNFSEVRTDTGNIFASSFVVHQFEQSRWSHQAMWLQQYEMV